MDTPLRVSIQSQDSPNKTAQGNEHNEKEQPVKGNVHMGSGKWELSLVHQILSPRNLKASARNAGSSVEKVNPSKFL